MNNELLSEHRVQVGGESLNYVLRRPESRHTHADPQVRLPRIAGRVLLHGRSGSYDGPQLVRQGNEVFSKHVKEWVSRFENPQ